MRTSYKFENKAAKIFKKKKPFMIFQKELWCSQ